VVAEHDDEGRF